jgi:hypothetical protein
LAGRRVRRPELRAARPARLLALSLALVAFAPAMAGADALGARLAAIDASEGAVRATRDDRVLASASSVRSVAQGAGASTAAKASAAAPGFTLRRVPNPNYRPPRASSPALASGTVNTLRAVDHARVQMSRRGEGTPNPLSEWEVSIGEQYRGNRAIEVLASLSQDRRGTFLRGARLSGVNGPLQLTAGDVTPVVLQGMATLHRMRGGAVLHEPRLGPSIRVMGGVPTPIPGFESRSIGVGAALVDRLEVEGSTLSFGAIGFGQGPALPTLQGSLDPDSASGGGGEAFFGVRTPVANGVLGLAIAGGFHDLDGTGSLTARHTIDWQMHGPTFSVQLRDHRATPRSRLIGMDQLRQAPTREDLWSIRLRALEGRGETHFTGAVRDGGDPSLETRTVTAGASGGWGRSAWYSGLDFTWDYRALTGIGERRTSLHTGRASRGGHAIVLRVQRNSNDIGGSALQASGEAMLALVHGLRLSLEPRVSWAGANLQDTHFETRLSLPLPLLGARALAGMSLGAGRETGFQTEVRQAELALSLVPRARDRGELEVRRMSEGPRDSYDYSAVYSMETARYDSPTGSWLTRADSGRVVVRVVRSGNLTGVPNVLVSLDNTELRFTDEDGYVIFERTPPGIHVVAIEERSLPENHEVVRAARAFVTVESGRIPDPVLFEIGRPSRRTTF